MEEKNPAKSFEPAKGINPSKYFDRIRFRDVAGLLGAILVLVFVIGVSSVSYKLHKESTDALDNHARVEENTELTYYLTVKEDGVDVSGTQSSDSATANISGGVTTITDRIPAGLEFQGFVTTEDGTIGAAARSDAATACGGHVIDDTKEETIDSGTWNADNTEYYYHGLHYDVESRLVSFKVVNVQAGCGLTVGIITKTPTLGNVSRKDFYNTAHLNEGILNLNSNTMHVWMGRAGATTYDVNYSYTGDVPVNAPAAPESQTYMEGSTAQVETSPIVEGYQFSGWTTSDAVITEGNFTMPASEVNFVGSFAEKPEGTKYSVTYVIEGDTPTGYAAPKVKQYEAGADVKLDSTSKGTIFDELVFSGWSSDDVEFSDSGFVMPDSNVTIYGSFTTRTYTVTYQFEGDVMPPNASELLPETREFAPGTKVTRAADPAADGYRFVGWYKNETFTMPAEDVTIYGEWTIQNGTFAPEISMEILNKQEQYQLGDIVEFEIKVKNTAEYAITDVQLVERLEGAEFVVSDGYELKTEQYALITEVGAGETVTLKAQYLVTEDAEQKLTNTVELIGAIANGNYDLDTSQAYVASVNFATTVIPEATDEDEDEAGGVVEDTENANTVDQIIKYVGIGLLSVAGLLMCVLMIRSVAQNNQQLANSKQGSISRVRIKDAVKNALLPEVISKRRLVCFATADVLLIAFAIGLAVNLPKRAQKSSDDPSTIYLMSGREDYDSEEAGAWQLTKSAKWIGDGEAELTLDVNTIAKTDSGKNMDIVFAVDISGSMMGDKLNQVKADMSEVVEGVLNNEENQIALVSFESAASLDLNFTNDKTFALEAIDALEAGNDTNYYDALKKVEDALVGYMEDENRELYILILTDGLPTVNSPNEVGEYKYIKRTYPYATIGAIQYEMGSNSIYTPIINISDEQYIADMRTLHNTLFDVIAFPFSYDTFTVTDLVNSDYFVVDDAASTTASLGTATLTEEDGVQKISWNMDGLLRSGNSATLTVQLKLKDEYKRVKGEYPTNKGESVTSYLAEVGEDSAESDETPILANNYTVSYEANSPSDCTVSGLAASETHFVYTTVEKSETIPTCTGYNFAGYEITTEDVQQFNEDYFRMPAKDVTLKATWTKASIEKTMDGTIRVAAKLYDVIAAKTNGMDSRINFANAPTSVANGKGVNTVASTADDEYPVYYYRGNVGAENNVLFANYCWKAVRTTSTGGVKLIYNGVPNASNQCTNMTSNTAGVTDIGDSAFNSNYKSPAYNGYMFGTAYVPTHRDMTANETVLTSGTLSTTYWYADSASYDTATNKWSLVDAYQVESTADYPNLVGKYTLQNAEESYAYSIAQYITAVNNSTYYHIRLNGNTTLEAQNFTYTYGDGYIDNGDGTYTITDSTEVKTVERKDWFSNYASVKDKYVCKNTSNNTCGSLRYAAKTTETSMSYVNPITNNYKYAKSFSYANGSYTLDESTAVSTYNLADENEVTKLSDAHYTCFNTSGRCSNIYYVYNVGTGSTYDTIGGMHYNKKMMEYIILKDGKSVEAALEEMQTNTNDSTIKIKIDTWYEANLKDTDDEDFLEDTVFCNDRSMANDTNGWVADGGKMTQDLSYGAIGRNSTNKEPSLDCPNSNDAFTVETANGNGALNYPIGLLTEDELTMAGHGVGGYGSYYLYTGRNSWSLSPSYVSGFGYASSISWQSSTDRYNDVSRAFGVRPVVSLAPGTAIAAGDGSRTSPWKLEKPE